MYFRVKQTEPATAYPQNKMLQWGKLTQTIYPDVFENESDDDISKYVNIKSA
jgi:hypothetical protein